MFSQSITDKVETLKTKMMKINCHIAVAEGITGGLLSAALTSVPGASEFFRRGYVTYSARSKRIMLGVPKSSIEDNGTISAHVTSRMALGILDQSYAQYVVAISGCASPGHATADKPVGTVYICVRTRDGAKIEEECHFDGDRDAVRSAAVEKALDMLIAI